GWRTIVPTSTSAHPPSFPPRSAAAEFVLVHPRRTPPSRSAVAGSLGHLVGVQPRAQIAQRVQGVIMGAERRLVLPLVRGIAEAVEFRLGREVRTTAGDHLELARGEAGVPRGDPQLQSVLPLPHRDGGIDELVTRKTACFQSQPMKLTWFATRGS